ncbi:hypothetical protein [Paenibacillus sp. FSL R7-0331]|uniref:hypothetical protein n=1 Tax=Paenibacillus sp. FSL R7-0331 TaxID=1536773 RepID=UPI0004F7BCE4|nr:hypothetical protein [Paenibacillus sp. FSL R7-0331]AIQ53422.1 hypothetical protein R70331_19040 [Paenibacillus sp. FSL R7-0331]
MRKFSVILIGTALLLTFMSGCQQNNKASESSQSVATSSSNSNTPTESQKPDLDEKEINDATLAAKDYKELEYEVKLTEDILSEESIEARNETMKGFYTEYFSKQAVDLRITVLPLQAAKKQQASLKPENLVFNLVGQKPDVVELRYNVDLVLLDQDRKEKERVPLEGVLTLFKENEKWLIQGDRFDSPAFQKLIDN